MNLITLCVTILTITGLAKTEIDWTRKEIGAITLMSTEFLKDMDMKMRDVHRVEKYYYGTHDFGAGRIFAIIESKFDHMVSLYKNTSLIMHIMGSRIDLRTEVVGSLQSMRKLQRKKVRCSILLAKAVLHVALRAAAERESGSKSAGVSDYMELLALLDMFKERYSYWRANSERARMRDIIKKFLMRHHELPHYYEENARKVSRPNYVRFEEWRRLFSNYFEDFD